jgi:hypothetical protein
MGVLSALPIIAVGNVCCCLWVISGGVVAAYALQQGQPQPITPADGAFVGFLSGVLGAFVYLVISVPIDLTIGPMERAMARRFLESMGGADGFRDTRPLELVAGPVRFIINFLTMLFSARFFDDRRSARLLMFRKREVPGAGDADSFNSPATPIARARAFAG